MVDMLSAGAFGTMAVGTAGDAMPMARADDVNGATGMNSTPEGASDVPSELVLGCIAVTPIATAGMGLGEVSPVPVACAAVLCASDDPGWPGMPCLVVSRVAPAVVRPEHVARGPLVSVADLTPVIKPVEPRGAWPFVAAA